MSDDLRLLLENIKKLWRAILGAIVEALDIKALEIRQWCCRHDNLNVEFTGTKFIYWCPDCYHIEVWPK